MEGKPSSSASGLSTSGDLSAARSSVSVDDGLARDPVPLRMSAHDIITDPIIRSVLVSYAFMATLTASIDVLLPLWLYTPVEKGGLSFTVRLHHYACIERSRLQTVVDFMIQTAQIGTILTILGISTTAVNLIIFPPLQIRAGTTPLYRASMMMYFVVIMLLPIIGRIATFERSSGDMPRAGSVGIATWIGVGALVVLRSFGGMVFA